MTIFINTFNNSTDTKKEVNKEKPKEVEDKKIGNISDKIKNLANSMNNVIYKSKRYLKKILSNLEVKSI